MKIKLIAGILILAVLIPLVACSLPGINYGDGFITMPPKTASPINTDLSTATTQFDPTDTAAPDSTEYLIWETPDVTTEFNFQPVVDIDFSAEVRVIHPSDPNRPEFGKEEAYGDIVGDALYIRNKMVEERLNIKFEWIGIPGSAAHTNDFVNTVTNYHAAGEHHDLIAAFPKAAGNIMTRGLMRDVNSVTDSYLELDSHWWTPSLTKDCMIGDSLFLLTGDISTNLIHSMHTVIFNSDLADSLALGDLYSNVNEGKWTLDMMMGLSQSVYNDKDGTGSLSPDELIGFGSSNVNLDALFTGSGLRYTERGEGKEFIKFSDDYSSQMLADLSKKISDLQTSGNAYITFNRDSVIPYIKGNMLFFLDRFYTLDGLDSSGMRNVDFSYGVLPVPKYDIEQEEYYTYAGSIFSFWGIADTAIDPSMSTAVLECLAYEGFGNTTPAIFENNLKLRYADAGLGVVKMFDLMRDSVRFDLGIYTVNDMKTLSEFTQPIQNYEAIMKRNITSLNKKLEDLFE